MPKLSQTILSLSLVLFLAAVANTRVAGSQETSTCNTSGNGEQCGTKTTCVAWRLTTGEISKSGFGAGATCASEVVTYLYKYVPPPPCTYCHYPVPGGGGTGSGGTGGGSTGSGGQDDCGDPDLWSDDGSGCDQGSQMAT